MYAFFVSCLAVQPSLYGLALVANSPTKVGLARIESDTGNTQLIGGPHDETFAMGDLAAVANGILYYLGDTSAGATLVGLNMTSGAKVCSTIVDVAEIKFVGIGQSLDYDSKTDSLLLSGAARSANGSHALYRARASGCGPMKHLGNFGLASYLPMLHASALDTVGQQLFVTVSPSADTSAIGVVDLANPTAPMKVIAEAKTPDLRDTLIGLHYDPHSSHLVSIVANDRLELHSLQPAKGRWEPPRPLIDVPTKWNALGGNAGTASAFDADSRTLFFLAGSADPGKIEQLSFDLGSLNVDTARITAHPPLAPVGMPQCTECLLTLTI